MDTNEHQITGGWECGNRKLNIDAQDAQDYQHDLSREAAAARAFQRKLGARGVGVGKGQGCR